MPRIEQLPVFHGLQRRWRFVHSSIAEYFAGVEVERDPTRWRQLLEDPFRPEWREIVLFCAGQLGVIEGRVESLDTLVKAILTKSRRKGRYDAKYPSLLMGLLRESPGLSRRQIDAIVERLLELVLTMAYSPAVALQVQSEFVMLLVHSSGAIADSCGTSLRRWFSESPWRIDWSRLTKVEQWDRVSLAEFARAEANEEAGFVAYLYVLGPFATALCIGWFAKYTIDIGPTLALWRERDDWRYRFAEWLLNSDRSPYDRPFGEVARELQLEQAAKARRSTPRPRRG